MGVLKFKVSVAAVAQLNQMLDGDLRCRRKVSRFFSGFCKRLNELEVLEDREYFIGIYHRYRMAEFMRTSGLSQEVKGFVACVAWALAKESIKRGSN